MFRAPWASLLIFAVILASLAAQSLLGAEALIARFALYPDQVWAGRWQLLLTCLFLHAGLLHAGANATAALAFGPPVARLFGTDLRGGLAFVGFYLVCGVLSSLGYASVHPDSTMPMIGASGAVSGLWGAASRLMERRGALSPLTSRVVGGQAVGFLIANLIMVAIGYVPGLAGGDGPVLVAWEAHLAGYAAGLLLIGPAVRFTSPSSERR